MHDTRLSYYLKGLSKKEMLNLFHFLNSSFYNKVHSNSTHKTISKKKIIILLKYIMNNFSNFSEDLLKNKLLLRKLFPSESYNEVKWRNIKYELTKIIELYLSYIDIIEEPVKINFHLINQLEKRNFTELLDTKIKYLDELLDRYELRDEEYYYQKYLLSHKKWASHERNIKFRKSEKDINILNEGIINITNAFLIILFKKLNLIDHMKTHMNVKLELNHYNKLYSFIKSINDIDETIPLIFILKELNNISNSSCDIFDCISKLRIYINKYENKLSFSDYQSLYIQLLNICCIQFSLGNIKYKNILIDILNNCINKELYLQNGVMHELNYTNIVSLLIRLGETKLAERFINDYKNKLSIENNNNAYLLNCATLQYHLKKYDMSLELLNKIKSKEFYYTTGINNMKLRIYYEINSLESASSLIDSYKHFFNKNKLIPFEYKTRYYNFLRYYEHLIKIRGGSTSIFPEMLIKKISKEKEIEFKGWLIKKLSEFK